MWFYISVCLFWEGTLFLFYELGRILSLKYMGLFQGRCSELKYRHCFKAESLF